MRRIVLIPFLAAFLAGCWVPPPGTLVAGAAVLGAGVAAYQKGREAPTATSDVAPPVVPPVVGAVAEAVVTAATGNPIAGKIVSSVIGLVLLMVTYFSRRKKP